MNLNYQGQNLTLIANSPAFLQILIQSHEKEEKPHTLHKACAYSYLQKYILHDAFMQLGSVQGVALSFAQMFQNLVGEAFSAKQTRVGDTVWCSEASWLRAISTKRPFPCKVK